MAPEVLRYFHPVLPVRLLNRRPRQIVLSGHRFVLFRNHRGEPAALDDLCPHRRAPLSQGRVRSDGRIACPYHGWNFDAHGRGNSPACPELSRLKTNSYKVIEYMGFLWLAQRGADPEKLPRLEWESFTFAGSISVVFPAPLTVTLDNVTEDEHFAYIHSTFGWDEEGSREVAIKTTKTDQYTEVSLQGPQRTTPWHFLGGLRKGDTFFNHWITRFDPVHTIYTFGWRDPATGAQRPVVTRAAVFLVPEDDSSTRAHMFIFNEIGPSIFRYIRPMVAWLSTRIASKELSRDAAFIRHVANVPDDLKGMKLTRFDIALAHNRKLLRAIYRGTSHA